jgi:hypothetical protein
MTVEDASEVGKRAIPGLRICEGALKARYERDCEPFELQFAGITESGQRAHEGRRVSTLRRLGVGLRRRLDQARLERPRHRLCPVGTTGLFESMSNVIPDGMNTQLQMRRDLEVRQAPGTCSEHLELPPGYARRGHAMLPALDYTELSKMVKFQLTYRSAPFQ